MVLVRLRAAALALLVAVWVEVLIRSFSLLFLLNFSTEGPNATAAWSLALASGFLLPWLARPRLRGLLLVAAAVGVGLNLLPQARIALLGTLLFLAASLPEARRLIGALGPHGPWAAVAGILVHQAARALFDGHPLVGTPATTFVLGAMAAGWLVLTWKGGAVEQGASVAPLVAFVWIQAVFFGSVPAVAAWVADETVPLVLFGGLGLWAGVMWGRQVPLWQAATAAVLGAIDILWVQAVPWATIALVQAGLAACLCRMQPDDHDAAWTGSVQSVLVAFVFLHVAAVNWAFVGFLPEQATHGQSATYLFLAAAVLPWLALARRSLQRGGRAA